MRVIANLSIRGKVLLIAAVAVIGSVSAVAMVLIPYRSIILEQKKIATKHVVETAAGVLSHYADLVSQGSIEEEQAKRAALDELKGMRYEGKEYFWVNDMHPTMIMHPIKPELDGRDLSGFKDSSGKRLFIAFVKTVKQHKAGYVDYLWPKPGSEKPVPKLSYVQGFPTWGWIIGSGIYIDDVDKEFHSKVVKSSAMVLIMVLMVIVVSIYVARWITVALRSAVDVADSVAAGDLTKKIDVQSNDEIGKLLAALKTMNERLLSIVSEVYVSSEYVDAAAKQISTGNGNLAERTQSQACALEETAATMEEMTATVRANADNAYQASSLVASAHSHAKDGGEVVSKAISAMGEINTSSKKIGDIISVINEIAFKTDLLALNASVEAARAAEHGKEFAVVAAEVRNLSLRSAEAANEIGGLIGNSVEKIRMGSNLVNESGHTLNEIVESVKKAAEMVSEIAAASQEQSVGIEQVNRAMIQIDEVTQQNAALVEEAAATSEEMEEQAQQMLKKVSFFKTEK